MWTNQEEFHINMTTATDLCKHDILWKLISQYNISRVYAYAILTQSHQDEFQFEWTVRVNIRHCAAVSALRPLLPTCLSPLWSLCQVLVPMSPVISPALKSCLWASVSPRSQSNSCCQRGIIVRGQSSLDDRVKSWRENWMAGKLPSE